MLYFDSLPKIIQTDNLGVSRIFTNLLARASVIPSVLKSPLIYYQYDIQEGDTPEIIAYKYYGDSYRYWIVLFTNELLDAQWNWPLNNNQLQNYLNSKYPETNVYATTHHYEKIITQYDVQSGTTTTNTVQIDEDTYNNLIEKTNTLSLPTGDVSVTTTKNVVSIYDYELQLNEAKRKINILNSVYVDQLETEFKNLMSA
jgi:hypothetical protein